MKKILALALLGTLLASEAQAVPVLSGGVGEESRRAIESVQRDFSLKVVFTGEHGIYLSRVNVSILDSQGNVVANNVTQGPMLLADLSPGRYTLEANVNGVSKRQSITVGQGLKTVQVRFPVQDTNSGEYPTSDTY